MNEWYWLIVAAVITALLLLTLHFAPQRRKLSQTDRYIAGVACLWLGYAVWRLPLGDWQTPIGLAVIIIAGGLAVLGGYEWDDITKDNRKVEKTEATDDRLKKS
jgi:membrane protein implicated in regulation of membrane protease activity